jgi:hypothetical protein
LELFTKLFIPRYRTIFSACHAEAMATYLHSDGKMSAYLPGFADAGLDVLEVEDIRVKGIAELAKLRGRLCFQCTLDAQSTMPAGDRAAIDAEAKEIVGSLATPEGGLIASIYWDPSSCGVSDEVQAAGVSAYERACDDFAKQLKG